MDPRLIDVAREGIKRRREALQSELNELDRLEAELDAELDAAGSNKTLHSSGERPKRVVSEATRKKLSRSMKARWEKKLKPAKPK